MVMFNNNYCFAEVQYNVGKYCSKPCCEPVRHFKKTGRKGGSGILEDPELKPTAFDLDNGYLLMSKLGNG
jgi:hypothetical protein